LKPSLTNEDRARTDAKRTRLDAIALEREPVEATPRKKITRHQRAVVFARQGGRCDGCGCKLFRPFIVDHVIQLWMGGADDVSNMHALCRACDAPKTAGDATNRAKVKRLIRDADPETRKQAKRQIHSGGFRGWRNFKNEIVWREDR
jgi:hypothetical protein